MHIVFTVSSCGLINFKINKIKIKLVGLIHLDTPEGIHPLILLIPLDRPLLLPLNVLFVQSLQQFSLK